jgi:hypothetical protein
MRRGMLKRATTLARAAANASRCERTPTCIKHETADSIQYCNNTRRKQDVIGTIVLYLPIIRLY